jgi:hypothetical protein
MANPSATWPSDAAFARAATADRESRSQATVKLNVSAIDTDFAKHKS